MSENSEVPSGGDGGQLIDTVQLKVVSSAETTGLDQALAKLNAIGTALDSVSGRMVGLGSQNTRSPAMFKDMIQQLEALKGAAKGSVTVQAIAEKMGESPQVIHDAFINRLATYKKDLDDYRKKRADLEKSESMLDKQAKKTKTPVPQETRASYAQQFKDLDKNIAESKKQIDSFRQTFQNIPKGLGMTIGSPDKAADFLNEWERKQNKIRGAGLQQLFGAEPAQAPKPTPVAASAPLPVTVETKAPGTPQPPPAAVLGKDPIGLTVPTTQILATLGPGEIHLNVPATQVTATPAGTTPTAAVPPSVQPPATPVATAPKPEVVPPSLPIGIKQATPEQQTAQQARAAMRRTFDAQPAVEPTPGTFQSIQKHGNEEDSRRLIEAVAGGKKPMGQVNQLSEANEALLQQRIKEGKLARDRAPQRGHQIIAQPEKLPGALATWDAIPEPGSPAGAAAAGKALGYSAQEISEFHARAAATPPPVPPVTQQPAAKSLHEQAVSPSAKTPTEPGYVYHATNTERAEEIAKKGLKLHKPNYGTDQSAWPDRSTEKRAYFSENAGAVWQFAPEEGKAAILRAKKEAHDFKTEGGTRDIYTTKPVPPKKLEILTQEGWKPLAPKPVAQPAAPPVVQAASVPTQKPAIETTVPKTPVPEPASPPPPPVKPPVTTTAAPAGTPPPPPPPKPEAKPGPGLINLTVPVSQIHAELGLGMITLMVPPGRIQASAPGATGGAGGAAVPPAAGAPQAGGTGGGGNKGGGEPPSGATPPPKPGKLIQEKITRDKEDNETHRQERELIASGQTLDTFFKRVKGQEGLVKDKTVETRSPAQKSAQSLESKMASAKLDLEQQLSAIQTPAPVQLAGDKAKSLDRQAALHRKQADIMRGFLSQREVGDDGERQSMAQRLEATGQGDLVTKAKRDALKLDRRAQTLEAQAATLRQKESTQRLQDVTKFAADEKRDQTRATAESKRLAKLEQTTREKKQQGVNEVLAATQTVQENLRTETTKQQSARLKREQAATHKEASYTEADRRQADLLSSGGTRERTIQANELRPGSPHTEVINRTLPNWNLEQFTISYGKLEASIRRTEKAQVAVQGATAGAGAEFLKHIATAATWIASYGVMHQAVQLVRTSLEKLIEVGPQVARLEQVFKGVGGTATQLAVDTMGLAAANGAEVHQAMEAAIQWSRLGLTRVQVNEAVRVSLMAANVAQIDALEATEALQGVMQAYGLSVGELRGELGQIVQISNSYNVTNKDMLTGLTRVAAVAKQAGLPLAELQGLLGATIGGTAQSGANIGNMMKSVILALSNPELQDKLRLRFRFEATTGGEGIKGMSAMLSDVFVKFNQLNGAQRQSFLFSTAGRTQASRLEAMLEGYVKAQYLAVNAQLHLGTAERENALIVASLKKQVEGLSAEWEKFIFIQGNRGPVQAMEALSTSLRNVLKLMSTPAGSWLTTGVMGLLAAGGIKSLMAGMSLKSGGGMIGSAGGHIAKGVESLNTSMTAAYAGMAAGQGGMMGRLLFGGVTGLTKGTAGMFDKWGQSLQTFSKGTGPAVVGLRAMAGAAGLASRALGVGLIALRQWVVPMVAIYGGMKLFNLGMEQMGLSSEGMEKRLSGVNEKAQAAQAAANAYAEAAETLRTVGRAIIPEAGFAGMNDEEVGRYVSQASKLSGLWIQDQGQQDSYQKALAAQTAELVKQGDLAGVRNRLEAEAAKYGSHRFAELQKESVAIEMQRRAFDEEIKRLKTTQANPLLGWYGHDDRKQKIEELESQKTQLGGNTARNIVAQTEAYETAFALNEQWQARLMTQKLLWESIAEIFSTIKADDPLAQSQAKIAMLDAQNNAIESHIKLLRAEDKADSDSDKVKVKKQAELKADSEQLRQEIGKIANFVPEPKRKELDVTAAPFSAPEETGVQKWMSGASAAMGSTGRPRLARNVPHVPGDIPENWIDHPEEEIKARQKKIAENDEAATSAGAEPGTPRGHRLTEIQKESEQARTYREEREAEQANRPMRDLQSKLKMGREEAHRETAPAAAGYNETQKLQNEQAAIQARIQELALKNNRTEEETAILAEDRMRAAQMEIQLWNRKSELLKEQKQLQYDMNREMQHSILGAGPAEMLRKLAAIRMSQGGKMGMGQYLSLSPGMRGDVNMVDPRFNPRGMDLRREQFFQDRQSPQDFSGVIKEYRHALDMLRKSQGDLAGLSRAARPVESREKTPEQYSAQVMNVTATGPTNVNAMGTTTITVSEKTMADAIGRYLEAHKEPVRAIGMAPALAGAGGSGGGAEH